MKELLEFLIKGIIGKPDFTVSESVDGNFVNLTVKTAPENIGLIIGKGGNTIKMIRNILRVKATLEKKGVSVNVEE